MQYGQTAALGDVSKSRLERWGLALLHFLGDFWLLFLSALLLGLLFIWVPQSKEVWHYYILAPLPGPAQMGWALLHAVFVVAGFLFAGLVFARHAQHRDLARQRQGRSPAVWMVTCAALLPLVLVLAGFWFAALDYLRVGAVQTQMLIAVCISGGLIALSAAAVVASARTRTAGVLADLVGGTRIGRLAGGCALILLAMFLVLPLLPPPAFVGAAQLIGAVPAMLLSAGLVVYAIDAAFRATGYRKPLALAALAIAVVGIMFGDLATAHRVRRIGTVDKDLPVVGNEFLRWLETRKDRDKYEFYPVFIVAAQGGGLYAGYHAARVLAILQDECPAFAQHVFAISGVSGGSLGAAVFASAVKSISPEQTLQPCRAPGSSTEFLDYTERFLKRDFLSPLGFLAVIPNIAQRIAGLPFTALDLAPTSWRTRRELARQLDIAKYDRALGLEYGFEQAWREANAKRGAGAQANFFEAPTAAAWSGADAVPALVLNATRADTGVAYISAPFRLDDEVAFDFRAKVLGFEAPWRDMRISTAVTLSARYPFATGPGMITVKGRKWLEKGDSQFETIGLVDGGFVENSGLATVGKLVRALHDSVVEHGKHKVAIYVLSIQDLSAVAYSHSGIDASGVYLPEDLRALVPVRDFDRPVRLGFAELTAPLLALDASRVARGLYTLNALIENVQTLQCAQGVAPQGPCTASGKSRSGEVVGLPGNGSTLFGVTATNHPLPLGWQLSPLSELRIEKRTWAGKHDRWSCEKQHVVPTGDGMPAMNRDDVAELLSLGEDLGGFVDRWIYACSRIHVPAVLKASKQ